jgi:DNA-binding winged helix-turn-helix (wHTH) protein
MNPAEPSKPRYRFAEFTLSPSTRVLSRGGVELPLIPRYFDLLILLVSRRNEAIHRREILDVVWSDVVVTDGALSQAVRILRRTLGDDPREPVYIRTVQRHGYRFVFTDVVEEIDDLPSPKDAVQPPVEHPPANPDAKEDPYEIALRGLLATDDDEDANGDSARREAAETLHALGTTEALARLDRREGHEAARALLRDTRWDVPASGAVPIVGRPGAVKTLRILFGLRLRRVVRIAGRRWIAGVVGGAVAGLLAGLLGGSVLRFGPGSNASNVVLVALPLVGALIGGVAAAGVGAGLSVAEALIRSRRGPALVTLGALGGGAIGAATHLLGLWTLEGLFGRDLAPVAGGFEGLVLGGAVGLGYALATPRAEGGMATPRGASRLATALIGGVTCAVAGCFLAWAGSHLGALSLDFMAQSFPGSQVGLNPLARLLGEETPGVVTAIVISSFEGFMFGSGIVLGLTHRPE